MAGLQYAVAPLCVAGLIFACGEAVEVTGTEPGAGGGASAGSGGAAPECHEENPYPSPYHVQESCCSEGQICRQQNSGIDVVCDETDERLCRGTCSLLLIGEGPAIAEAQCHCGIIGYDGQKHHGPGPCPEGAECCRTIQGWGACTPRGTCSDCSPSTSGSPAVAVDCCFTLGGAEPCRGACNYLQECACEQGDGGCGEGLECCINIPGTNPPMECVPFGECDHGPCPPEASSPAVVVSCCASFPCRGVCESLLDRGQACFCGSDVNQWGCAPDEECCVGPSGDPQGADTQCVPSGQCVPPP